MGKKGENKLNLISEIYGEKTLEKINGFDNAIIGLEVKTDRLIYSVKKCLNIVNKTNPTEETIDYFYTEIYSKNAKENQVVFCEDYLTKKPNF